jgi:transcriptional regulator with XRE-family HTH domain
MEIRLIPVQYTLRDPALLRKLMEHPGRGAPYSTRTLAEAAGITDHRLVWRLTRGKKETVDLDVAHRIAEALGVAVLVLFAPPTSPERIDPEPE